MAAAACLQRLATLEESPASVMAANLPILGLITVDFASHQTPAAVSKTVDRRKRKNTSPEL